MFCEVHTIKMFENRATAPHW